MGSLRGSAITMATAAVLLLLVVVAEGVVGPSGRRGGGKHHHHGMDDCGRNRTCRELSRECKKMFLASMVDDYVDAGDDEIITTVEKMAAMMEMLTEHQKNLTDCANEKGINLTNSDRNNGLKGFRGGKWYKGNFGVSTEDAIELKKCLLNKKELLNSDATLNRESFKAQISSAYDSHTGVQTAVEEAVDSCPEPQDFNIYGFIKCINKACIDNLELDDDEDSQQENKRWGVLP